MSSGAFWKKRTIAGHRDGKTIQYSVRIPDTVLQSIVMATMTAISSTNPTGSSALLPAAPVGAVDDDDVTATEDLEVEFVPP